MHVLAPGRGSSQEMAMAWQHSLGSMSHGQRKPRNRNAAVCLHLSGVGAFSQAASSKPENRKRVDSALVMCGIWRYLTALQGGILARNSVSRPQKTVSR